MKRLNALTHLCPFLKYATSIAYESEPFIDDSVFDTIMDMAPKFNETFHNCRWQSKLDDCSKYFVPTFTEDGYCFTFNSLNSRQIYTDQMAPGILITNNIPNVSDWSLENDGDDIKYPVRVAQSGRDASLDIGLMFNEQDTSYSCNGLHKGFKIILTTPGEALKIARIYFRVPIAEDSIITIKPKLIITSDGLRSYSPKQRQCFYQSERQLRFFNIYSKSNCEDECLANFTKSQCGCVQFSMPRDRDTKICNAALLECYEMFGETRATIEHTKYYRENCNCLPACTSIEYHADIDRVEFNMSSIRNMRKNQPIDKGLQLAKLSIFFGDQEVKIVKRIEVYSFSDFMAICGGLLGLFMGISALSIIELIYYSTLRLFWTIWWKRSENISVQSDQ